jgi:hypothetical protein
MSWRAIKTGEECDVHEWRRYLVWQRGEVRKVKRRTNKRERREADQDIRAYVSQLWAEDWDSPEDAAYDA